MPYRYRGKRAKEQAFRLYPNFSSLSHTKIGRPDLHDTKGMQATTGLGWPGVFRHVIRTHTTAWWQQFIRQWMRYMGLDKRSHRCRALGRTERLCIAARNLVSVL
jgi:hypothetical protein